MRDRRSVDDLTIEELEEILSIKKRQARMQRLQRFERLGRRRGDVPLSDEPSPEKAPAAAAPVLPYESYLSDEPTGGQGKPRRSNDRLLVGIEVAAALGLVAILVYAALALQKLNRESSVAQANTINSSEESPTPAIRAVVLPGGHTPPTDTQDAQPNYNEVPTSLRPLVEQQFAGPVDIPTPAPSSALRIRIPAIGVDAPVVQGDGWEQLKKGVGQHLGSADPGQAGNIVLSAHDDIYGQIFRHLDGLQRGDLIYLDTQIRTYTYTVDYWRIVEPTEVSVMDQTSDPIVTLISCYPFLVNTQRIVVIAELQQ